MVSGNRKAIYIYLLVYLFLWIVLFEFILPVNNILPKPSIVIESFPSLTSDYQLFPNYISTVAVIYIALTAAYFLVMFISGLPEKKRNRLNNFIFSLEWFSEYVPGIVLGLLLIFWFPASEYTEFIFAFFSAFIPMMIRLQRSAFSIPDEYTSSSLSLGLSEGYINRNIRWKFSRADIFQSLKRIHFNLWLVLIAFEYIKGGYGIGNIFQRALNFTDLSAFFSALIITGLTVYLGSLAIRYISEKTIFWK